MSEVCYHSCPPDLSNHCSVDWHDRLYSIQRALLHVVHVLGQHRLQVLLFINH